MEPYYVINSTNVCSIKMAITVNVCRLQIGMKSVVLTVAAFRAPLGSDTFIISLLS